MYACLSLYVYINNICTHKFHPPLPLPSGVEDAPPAYQNPYELEEEVCDVQTARWCSHNRKEITENNQAAFWRKREKFRARA